MDYIKGGALMNPIETLLIMEGLLCVLSEVQKTASQDRQIKYYSLQRRIKNRISQIRRNQNEALNETSYPF